MTYRSSDISYSFYVAYINTFVTITQPFLKNIAIFIKINSENLQSFCKEKLSETLILQGFWEFRIFKNSVELFFEKLFKK